MHVQVHTEKTTLLDDLARLKELKKRSDCHPTQLPASHCKVCDIKLCLACTVNNLRHCEKTGMSGCYCTYSYLFKVVTRRTPRAKGGPGVKVLPTYLYI